MDPISPEAVQVLRERIKRALWPDDLEVVEKRRELLQRALVADPLLGAAIPHMLAMDHHERFSAAHVLRLLNSHASSPTVAAQASNQTCFVYLVLGEVGS